MKQTDFLIIGSGIAGLSFAIKTAEALPDAEITIVTKAGRGESNTKYAQGGIAAVIEKPDSFDQHIADTLKAGDGLCDPDVVRMVITDAPRRLGEIISWGVRFDKEDAGKYALAREGGHSANRILHHKDATGKEIERALLNKIKTLPNVKHLQHVFAVDLITYGGSCAGAVILHRRAKRFEIIYAKVTLLATGGAGQVYAVTTNPQIATGDGIAMAYRAGARVAGMEFVQFHPTALYEPGTSPAFLISEAVRGFGARLCLPDGTPFMAKYDPREALASRDIVARAIVMEMQKHGLEYVCLDCRHIPESSFKKRFPVIYRKCIDRGINPAKDFIPVVPAAHYMCGGIVVDKHGRTTIRGLYACGECSYTGLHGANRLASNSLLEAVVYAHNAHIDAVNYFKHQAPDFNPAVFIHADELYIESSQVDGDEHPDTGTIRQQLQQEMMRKAGIVRDFNNLKKLHRFIDRLNRKLINRGKGRCHSIEYHELRNLLCVALLIVAHSLKRKENRGAYFNIDLLKSSV